MRKDLLAKNTSDSRQPLLTEKKSLLFGGRMRNIVRYMSPRLACRR